MTGPFANRLFRIAFVLAGCYNLAFGLWAAIWPLSFFRLFDILPPRYPGIWACLGMVVGVYGLLYLHAAWKLESAWPIVAVGLLGKVLGPIGMVMSFGDDWPPRLGMLCIYNDLIWWLPFGLFLIRGTVAGRRVVACAPALCVLSHLIASAILVVLLKPGTSMEPDHAARADFIAGHLVLWSVGWATWMLAAASFVSFCAWWAGRLTRSAGGPIVSVIERRRAAWATVAVVIAAFGLVCDFSGEGSLVLLLLGRLAGSSNDTAGVWNKDLLASVERAFRLLSPATANGLYTIGGMMLTLATPDLPKWVRTAMWITWIAGIGMTAAALADYSTGMVVSTAVLFPPFIIWVAWMGAGWRRL